MTAEPTHQVSVALHKDSGQDEPLELDVDVVVSCGCGHKARERCQLYKESDTANVFCAACGAEYEVGIRTTVHFDAVVTEASDGFLAACVPASEARHQGGAHVE